MSETRHCNRCDYLNGGRECPGIEGGEAVAQVIGDSGRGPMGHFAEVSISDDRVHLGDRLYTAPPDYVPKAEVEALKLKVSQLGADLTMKGVGLDVTIARGNELYSQLDAAMGALRHLVARADETGCRCRTCADARESKPKEGE